MYSSRLIPGPVPDDMRLVGIELVRAHLHTINAEQEAQRQQQPHYDGSECRVTGRPRSSE